MRTTVVSSDGKIVFDSDAEGGDMPNHLNRPEVAQALKGERAFVSRYSNTLNTQMLYLAVPAGNASDGVYDYCVRLAIPKHNLDFAKSLLLKEIGALSLLAVLLAAAVSWILARRVSVPVNSLRKRAGEFARGEFDTRLEASSIYEISQLGASMSDMARQLKKRINSLHKRNCELDEIFSHMSECVLICAEDGRILRENAAARKIFEIEYPEGSRPKFSDVIKNRQLIVAIEKTFAGGAGTSCDIDISSENEKIMTLESVMLPYESRTRRALFVLHDVSAAKAAEKLRREFVAAVSHELRTPIAGIMGSVEILNEGADADETKQLLNIISRDSKRMNSLVEDMLLLSKMEAPEYLEKMNFKDVQICGMLFDVRAAYENEAAKRGQTLTLECDENIFAKIDAPLISLAMSNLVANAIKYSFENSEIKIYAKKIEGGIEMGVADKGPGIDLEHGERVFERFYRVEKGRSRDLGGSGIGLSIVKHAAIVHGGAASLESAAGRGSTFKITLKKDI